MKIMIDLDDTLSFTRCRDWQNSKPIQAAVERVREIQGKIPSVEVWIHTSRGMNSCKGDVAKAEERYRSSIEELLKTFGVKVDGIIFGKPLADLYVDDKAMSAEEFKSSKIETFSGLSGARITRIGRMVIKEAQDVQEQADWYEQAAAHGFSVPKVYSCQLGKIYMEYVEGKYCEPSPVDVMNILRLLRRFEDIPMQGSNDLERYAWHCHQRAAEAGVSDGGLRERLERCGKLEKRTFCHGDFSLPNILKNGKDYTLIDPSPKSFMSHWMLDAAKFRASLNWLDYGLRATMHKDLEVRLFDMSFSEEEQETIKVLEESHYYRVLRYAVKLGKYDVARRLKEAFERRVR